MIKEFFEKNKIFFAITLTALITGGFIFLPGVGYAEAKRGCCSWHGGVCGCRCCDGTPLSAKCAPYYPHCYAKPLPKYEPSVEEQPPVEEQSTKEPAIEEEQSAVEQSSEQLPVPQESLPVSEKFTAEIPKEDGGGGSIFGWIMGVGFVAFLFYTFEKRRDFKREKNK